MITVHGRPRGQLVLLGLVILYALALAAAEAWALSPADLIVVFNRNLPESQTVAQYYAQQRQVPESQLLGVDVPTSERMSRSDYDQRLAPPVRALVQQMQDKGKTPALLLVYGIPLIVEEVPLTPADHVFRALAAAKVKEYQDLVLQMVRELDRLTAASDSPATPPPEPGKSYSAQDVLAMGVKSLERGARYLEPDSSRPRDEAKRLQVYSLMLRLVGTSPAARAAGERMSQRGKQDRQLLPDQELLRWDAIMRRELSEEIFWGILPEKALETATAVRLADGLLGELKFWEHARQLTSKVETLAAVDSELTLVLVPRYQPGKWLPNPFHARFDRLPFIQDFRGKTIMVGRLDGPTVEIARRLVDDAIATEKTGLQGTLYIDARGLAGEDRYGGYTWYDHHLINLADMIKTRSPMQVVLDIRPELFAPGSCPDAALYCGWYSLAKYVACCTWRRGAVGYHVASAEASTLKTKNSTVWCKRMLEEGVAATLGPVAEPYLMSFPLPDEFFPLLMMGIRPLLEVYFRTLPHLSWRQILIGDPLYTPFKKDPAFWPPPTPAE